VQTRLGREQALGFADDILPNAISARENLLGVSDAPWQVLHVVANHEKRVAQHLAVRSLEHYLPLYTERSQWSDRSVLLERPLFTGYVFVRFAPEARLPIVTTPGVLRLLGNDERYTVSAAEIDRIREGLVSGCLLRPHRGVSLGTRVRVRAGVFEGVVGVVTELRRPCKVVIALAAIQQSFSLEVELDDVEVLKDTPARLVQEPVPAKTL
jgi:transcription antitermination factor NusG